MEWIVFPIMVLAPFLIAGLVHAIRNGLQQREFEEAADLESGPVFTGPDDSPELAEHEGMLVEIHEWSEYDSGYGSQGGHYDEYTRYQVDLPDAFPDDAAVFDLMDYEEVGHKLRSQDLEVGVEDLDEKLVFQADDPERLAKLFENPEVVDLFRDMLHAGLPFGIEHGSVWVEQPRPNVEENVTRKFDILKTFRDRLQKALADDQKGSPEASETDEGSSAESATESSPDEVEKSSSQAPSESEEASSSEEEFVTEW